MAISFCLAFSIHGGQFVISACRGGGSCDWTSSWTERTSPARTIPTPCTLRLPPICLLAIAIRAACGSALCLKTDVLPSLGLGKKADCLTADLLNCPEEVRKRASGSSSATSSGNPEGRIIISNALNLLKDTRRNLTVVAECHYVPMLCPINPRTGHSIRSTYTYRKRLCRSRRPVESGFAIRLYRNFRQRQILRQQSDEERGALNRTLVNGFCAVAIPVRFGTFCR